MNGAHARLALACTGLAVAAAVFLPSPAAAQSTDWTIYSHPCPGGNRTDALHRDDDGTLWVGCGTNATGYGLFTSPDGGMSWQAANVTPSTVFNEFRVSSISRGHDGALYAAGFNASTREMVLRVDTASLPHPVTSALTGVPTVGYQFHVGSYRELSDGRAIAESLNGNDLLYRPDASTGASASDWTSAGLSVQILDLVTWNDEFFGSGSRIVEPPRVFLPPVAPGAAPHEFVTLDLQPASGWEGELWGVAVNASRVVAVGVDQDNDIGKIFVSDGDPYVASDYEEISMSAITGDTRTWARGVCMQGDRIVVVGEKQPLASGSGRVLMSVNGGIDFTDVTPAGVSTSVSRCVFAPDGVVTVAGANGFIGVLADNDRIFDDGFDAP